MSEIKKIGRYEVESLLGEGAMGSVFKARDPFLERTVAIKIVKMDKAHTDEDTQNFFERFIQEGRISAQLNHQNIVTIHDVGQQEGMPYIAMEFVEGYTLTEYVNQEEKPSPAEMVDILARIAGALDVAHEKGIVHRDLKPANIMVLANGEPKIMDFGIAKMSGSNLTQTGVFLGTPSYSSPEQIKEGHVDHRSDIFSFGILACETLTGLLPFGGKSINAILYKIANEPPHFADSLGDLPIKMAAFRQIFSKVLHKDPDLRYQCASDFINALIQAMELSDTEKEKIELQATRVIPMTGAELGKQLRRSDFETSGVKAPPVQIPAPKKRSKVLPVALVLLLLVAAGVAYLYTTNQLDSVITQAKAKWMEITGDEIVADPVPDSIDQTPVGGEPDAVTKTFTITSAPEGAKVLIDDQELGTTPYTHNWSGKEGDQLSFKLELDNFQPVEQTLTFGDQVAAAYPFELISQLVKRVVRSTPEGAYLQVDTERIGKMPIEFEFEPGRSYTIRFILAGYHTKRFTYTEGSSDVNLLDGEMKKLPPPGTLSVRTVLRGLRVSIDGRGRTGRDISLPPGDYQLNLKADRYFYSESRDIEIKSGEELIIETPDIVTIPKVDYIGGFAQVRINGIFVKNGDQIDTTPLVNLQITAGTHEFEFLDTSGNIVYKKTIEVVNREPIIVPTDD